MTCEGCKGQGSPRPRTQKVISKDSSSIVNLHSTSSQTYPRSSSMFLKDFLAKSLTTHKEDTPLDESNEDEGVLPNVEAPAFTGYESDLLDDEPVEVVIDIVVHNEQESGEARGESLNNCQVWENCGGNSGNSGCQVQTYEMSEGTSASAYVLCPFQTPVPRFQNEDDGVSEIRVSE